MAVSGAWADLVLIVATCVVTAALAAAVIRHAVALKLAQAANARSSHVGTRPTGGGIGIVVAVTLSGLWLAWQENLWLAVPAMLAFSLGLVGFQDDRLNLPVRLRLLLQGLALVLLVIMVPQVQAALDPLPAWLAWPILIVGGLVWINFYNFMDGIDGLATGQAAFLGTAILVLALLGAGTAFSGIWVWTMCLTCAALTFLMFNWSPSRIFMGDGGAYFLSFSLLVVALAAAASGSVPLASSAILAGLFVSDAGVTLLRRILRGENWTEGHRTHAYQNLSQRFGHAGTVLIYMAINVCWLLPWALIVQNSAVNPWIGLLVAYLPLLVFVVRADAGHSQNAF